MKDETLENLATKKCFAFSLVYHLCFTVTSHGCGRWLYLVAQPAKYTHLKSKENKPTQNSYALILFELFYRQRPMTALFIIRCSPVPSTWEVFSEWINEWCCSLPDALSCQLKCYSSFDFDIQFNTESNQFLRYILFGICNSKPRVTLITSQQDYHGSCIYPIPSSKNHFHHATYF